jgi:hypothetical protein
MGVGARSRALGGGQVVTVFSRYKGANKRNFSGWRHTIQFLEVQSLVCGCNKPLETHMTGPSNPNVIRAPPKNFST